MIALLCNLINTPRRPHTVLSAPSRPFPAPALRTTHHIPAHSPPSPIVLHLPRYPSMLQLTYTLQIVLLLNCSLFLIYIYIYIYCLLIFTRRNAPTRVRWLPQRSSPSYLFLAAVVFRLPFPLQLILLPPRPLTPPASGACTAIYSTISLPPDPRQF